MQPGKRGILIGGLAILAGGCFTSDPYKTAALPDRPGAIVAPPRATNLPQPSLEVASRVDGVGRQLLAANPQIGIQPLFRTIGGAKPEIFHVGTSDIYITEDLVKLCTTEAQLAAVLASELGKMVAEREAMAGKARETDGGPPREVALPPDVAGARGSADQTHLAELGRYEKQRRHRRNEAPPLPNPDFLAQTYLTAAGFAATELVQVAPLLQTAANNATFEKQIKGTR